MNKLFKKKIIALFFSIIIILTFSLSAAAHSGKNDAYGGHYDRSTGMYHYHHGYPAHQHDGDVCPYNYNDNSNHNQNSESDKIWNPATQEYQNYNSTADYYIDSNGNLVKNKNKTEKQESVGFLHYIRIVLWSVSIPFFPTLMIFFIIYGIYQLITKEYMSNKSALVLSSIIFFSIAILCFEISISTPRSNFVNTLSVICSFDFKDILFDLLPNMLYSILGSGFTICVLLDFLPAFRNLQYNHKKIFNIIQITLFIILFIVFLDFLIIINT